MNLQNLNVRELNAKEAKSLNGGGEPKMGGDSNGNYLYWFNKDTGKYEGVYLDLFA